MSRIEKTFKALDRAALITFVTACDPDFETSLEAVKALSVAGADIIEIGMPFSDPVADGPVIQEASQRALKAGGNMHKTFELVREFRKTDNDTPIVLMGYANPVFIYGMEKFAKDAVAAGADGVIIVDLPPEEDEDLQKAAKESGLDVVRLITPTTDEKRLPALLKNTSGFLYYVAVAGITGAAKAEAGSIAPHIEIVKKHTDLPVAVGFGIKTPDDAKEIANIADGVVVGSAIVQTIEKNGKNSDLSALLKDQVSALSSVL